jgi:adenylate cyclase
LTRLSKIAELKVISRASTQNYQNRPANLREIGRQLRVAHILEGSVQKSGEFVRANVQLIKAANDSHLCPTRLIADSVGDRRPEGDSGQA